MSMYSAVSRIYTPRHSVHLRFSCISIHPPSLLEDVLGGRDRASLEMHLVAVIKRVWRYLLGSNDRANFEATMKQFGGRNRAILEIHLEAEIE